MFTELTRTPCHAAPLETGQGRPGDRKRVEVIGLIRAAKQGLELEKLQLEPGETVHWLPRVEVCTSGDERNSM